MNLVIKNEFDKACTAEDFLHVKRELVRALADYLIANDLVKIDLVRGDLVVMLKVEKIKNYEKEKETKTT